MLFDVLQKIKMKPFNPERTEPTLDYLKRLSESGDTPVDVEFSWVREDLGRMTVFFDGSESSYFYFDQSDDVLQHYKEAIAFTGFGPRGYGNWIHMDVIEASRELEVTRDALIVGVSREAFERIGHHGKRWTYYGYKFVIDESLPGVSHNIIINRPSA